MPDSARVGVPVALIAALGGRRSLYGLGSWITPPGQATYADHYGRLASPSSATARATQERTASPPAELAV